MLYFLIIPLSVFLLFLGLSSFSKHLITTELKKEKSSNRISETKIYKTITRRNESFEYEFPFSPNLDNLSIRLFAKIIDFGFYFFILYLIKESFQDLKFIPLFIAFLFIFIVNPIFETISGKTIGKFLLGIEVINDFGKTPSLLKSYVKNGLQLGLIIVYISSQGSFWEDDLFFHNKKTLTYTVKSKDKKNILQILKTT